MQTHAPYSSNTSELLTTEAEAKSTSTPAITACAPAVNTKSNTASQLANDDLEQVEKELADAFIAPHPFAQTMYYYQPPVKPLDSTSDISQENTPIREKVRQQAELLKKRLIDAKNDVKNEEYHELKRELTKLTTINPCKFDAYFMLGILSAFNKNRTDAIKLIKIGFDNSPGYFSSILGNKAQDFCILSHIVVCYDETLQIQYKDYKQYSPEPAALTLISKIEDTKCKELLIQKYLTKHPLFPPIRILRTHNYLCMGNLDSFEREFEILTWLYKDQKGIDSYIHANKVYLKYDESEPLYFLTTSKAMQYQAQLYLHHNHIAALTKQVTAIIKLKELYMQQLLNAAFLKKYDLLHKNVKQFFVTGFNKNQIINDKLFLMSLLKSTVINCATSTRTPKSNITHIDLSQLTFVNLVNTYHSVINSEDTNKTFLPHFKRFIQDRTSVHYSDALLFSGILTPSLTHHKKVVTKLLLLGIKECRTKSLLLDDEKKLVIKILAQHHKNDVSADDKTVIESIYKAQKNSAEICPYHSDHNTTISLLNNQIANGINAYSSRGLAYLRKGDIERGYLDLDIALWITMSSSSDSQDVVDIETKKCPPPFSPSTFFYLGYLYNFALIKARSENNPNKVSAYQSKISELNVEYNKVKNTDAYLSAIKNENLSPLFIEQFNRHFDDKRNSQQTVPMTLKKIEPKSDTKLIDAKKIEVNLAKDTVATQRIEQAPNIHKETNKQKRAKIAAIKRAEKESADKLAEIETAKKTEKEALLLKVQAEKKNAAILLRSQQKKIKKQSALIKSTLFGIIDRAIHNAEEKVTTQHWLSSLDQEADKLTTSTLRIVTQEISNENRIALQKKALHSKPVSFPKPASMIQGSIPIVIKDTSNAASTSKTASTSIKPIPANTNTASVSVATASACSRSTLAATTPAFIPKSQSVRPLQPIALKKHLVIQAHIPPQPMKVLTITISEAERSIFMPLQYKFNELVYIYGGSVLDRVCGVNVSRDIDAALTEERTSIVNHLKSEFKDQKDISIFESKKIRNLCKVTINNNLKIDISGSCYVGGNYYLNFMNNHTHFTIASFVSNLSGELYYTDRAIKDLLEGRITTVKDPNIAYALDGTLIFHAIRYLSKMKALSAKRDLDSKQNSTIKLNDPIDYLLAKEGKRRKFSEINWHISQNDLNVFDHTARIMVFRSISEPHYCSYILYQFRERLFENNGHENLIELHRLGIISILFGVISPENIKWLQVFARGDEKNKPRSLLLPALLIAVAAGKTNVSNITHYSQIKSACEALILGNPFFKMEFYQQRSSIYTVLDLSNISYTSLLVTVATQTGSPLLSSATAAAGSHIEISPNATGPKQNL